MYEALKPCLSGLQLAVSDFILQGDWVATGPYGVVASGKLTMISIPEAADTVHLNIEDFEKLTVSLKG